MPGQILALLRDMATRSGESMAARLLAAVATLLLAMVAFGFLTASGFGFLAHRIGAPMAALAFAGLFGVLALIAYILGQARAERQRQQAVMARAQIANQVASARTLLAAAGMLPAVAAFLAAFALARKK